MWKMGLILTAALCVLPFINGQQGAVVTPGQLPFSGWESTEKLPSGREMKLRFELRIPRFGKAEVPGPQLVIPCNGPAEEANMKGWSDGTVNVGIFTPYAIAGRVRRQLGVGGDAGDAGREIIRKVQTKVETDITQMIRVRPAEGSGPRKDEVVVQYIYVQRELYVLIGEKDTEGTLLASFYVPLSDPMQVSSRPCEAVPSPTACSFGGFGVDKGGTVTMTPLPPVDKHPTGFVGAVYEPELAGQIKDSGFAVTGIDVNAVSVTEPTSQGPLKWIYLPTGTVLVPSAGGIQSMITVDPLLLTSTQFASLTPEMLTAKNIAVHCLEIEKDPPNPAVKFTPSRPSDPVYRNLAQMTQKSAIKGPWDQARIWIYADKASLQKVNKRLEIGCPPGMYLRALYEIYTMGGFTDKELLNTEIFRPEYLGAVSNRKEAATWFALMLAGRNPMVLRNYLGGGGKELAELLTSSNPLASDQFTRIMLATLTQGNADVRVAMLRFLANQDSSALKKAMPRPPYDWERHIQALGEEAELGKKLKETLQ